MRILYCHNYYRHRGGEDVSFESDVKLLRRRGHEVITYTKDNQHLGSNHLSNATRTVWNRQAASEVEELIRRTKPHLMHCNNLFPQISTSIYKPARAHQVPIVQALRNYRSFCANSFFYRAGKVCTKCLHSLAAWNGISKRCYRNDRLATSVLVASQGFNRVLRIQDRYVDAFITPTQFSKSIHCEGGFDSDRIHVRPNFILPDPGFQPDKLPYFVVVGRLSLEKGVRDVIHAWRNLNTDCIVKIIGGGPESSELKELAGSMRNVEFLGELAPDDLIREVASAQALLMPSRWFETFGRTMGEAFACGTPVLASRLGAMEEMVTEHVNGMFFEAGNPRSIAETVKRFMNLTADERAEMSHAARHSYVTRMSAAESYDCLLSIYRLVGMKCNKYREPWYQQIDMEWNRSTNIAASNRGSTAIGTT
ncbi:MAG: glycosyltransferase [Planctomycetota bacterium]